MALQSRIGGEVSGMEHNFKGRAATIEHGRQQRNATLRNHNVQGDVGVSGLVIGLAATAIVADCRKG